MVRLFDTNLPTAVQDAVKAKLFRRLDIVEARLADADYVMGGRFTLADAYLFTVLGWMRFFSIGLDRWPSISDYMLRIGERPSVSAAYVCEQEIAPVEE